MNYLVVICGLVYVIVCIMAAMISYTTSDSRKYGKLMAKKVAKISSAIDHSKKGFIEVFNNTERFLIKIEDQKVAPGIYYSTIPVYTCKNIYINDELVCKLHKLNGTFTKTYCTEFSCDRVESEIASLIDKAFANAKKIDKEYWKNFSTELPKKSFYNNNSDK